jgi:hypothetical protein
MSVDTPPPGPAALEGSSSQAAPRWHYFAIFLIPAVLSLINPNWLFQNMSHMDPWFYFGEFRHFPRFQNLLPNYAGERMTWIAPGYLLVHLLGQARGVILLHWCVFLAGLYLLHDILRRLTDYRTALVGAVMLGCHPFYIASNGWDHPESLAIALLLLSLALAIRTPSAPHRRDIYVFLSGLAWFSLAYTYVVWLMFTPAWFFVVVRSAAPGRSLWRTLLRVGWLAFCGALAATAAVWGAFRLLGGKGFFFHEHLMTFLHFARLQNNPWIDPQWYLGPGWLVFPALAACLAFLCAAAVTFRRLRLSKPAAAIIWFYLYCFAAMVAMTFRENRALATQYSASILMPGVFLTLGIVLFRVPETIRPSLFYRVTALGGLVCVIPLVRAIEYLRIFHWGFIVPMVLLVLAVGCWMRWRPSNRLSWAAAVVLSSVMSVGLAPASSPAWWMKYRGRDLSERVTRAMQVVIERVPQDRYPVFWVNDRDSQLLNEYRAIMCAFLAHGLSMEQFLKVDKHYESGTRIMLPTQQRDATAAARYLLARAGMPAVVVSQDQIDYGGVRYWIAQLEVLPLTMANLRRGLTAVRLDSKDIQSFGVPELPARKGTPAPALKKMTLPDSGVYQFELRYRLSGGTLRFGAVSPDGKWIDESGPPMEQGGDQVSWFRLGVKAGEPVELALQVDLPAGSPPGFAAPPALSVFRDGAAVFPEVFDAMLERPDPEGNLIGNGRFDAGLGGWDWGGGELNVATDCHKGGCAEFVTHSGGGFIARWDAATLRPGVVYEYKAWIKSASAAPQPWLFGIWDSAAVRWVACNLVSATPEWREVKLTFRNDSSNPVTPEFIKNSPLPGALLVDEMVLREAPAP